MAVTLNTNALTTTAEALAVLGLTSSAENDSLANRLINSASDLIEKKCGRKFLLADEVEAVKGYGTDKLRLSRFPLVSVTSITYEGATVDITDLVTLADSGMVQLPGGFTWTAHYDGTTIDHVGIPGTELPKFTVTYRGGYITPQYDADPASPFDGDDRNLPYDLEEACLALIRHRYFGRTSTRDPSVKSVKLRTWAETYDNKGSALPPEVEDAIALYTRWV